MFKEYLLLVELQNILCICYIYFVHKHNVILQNTMSEQKLAPPIFSKDVNYKLGRKTWKREK